MFCLTLNKTLSLEEAWERLENKGIDVLYGTEEEEVIHVYVKAGLKSEIPHFDGLIDCVPYTLPPIDWEAQWAAHGLDFRDGMIHVALDKYGKNWPTIVLKPGPGFGDLSHPTTNIVLDMLAQYIHGETVIDIGCGSGILSLAAVAMGASEVFGIDIDQEALAHSQENARLNGMDGKCHFIHPGSFAFYGNQKPVLMVMNMISSEQEVALESLPSLHGIQGTILISGIRTEERASYLRLIKNRKWKLVKEIEQDGWLGFCFSVGKVKHEKGNQAGTP